MPDKRCERLKMPVRRFTRPKTMRPQKLYWIRLNRALNLRTMTAPVSRRPMPANLPFGRGRTPASNAVVSLLYLPAASDR